jgi:hypothetical protein
MRSVAIRAVTLAITLAGLALAAGAGVRPL